MEKQTQTLTVDRIEEGIVISFSSDGQKYTFPLENLPLKENDIFKAEITENNNIIFLEIYKKETQERRQSLKSRLKKLFNK